jgi:hypothetical protein
MQPFMADLEQVIDSQESRLITVVGSPERGSRVFHTSLTPLLCQDTKTFGVLVIARDVTEFVRGSGDG